MNVSQRNFSAGEIAPALYARTDTDRYVTGLRTLRNATVLKTGGVRARPGLVYKGATKSSGIARLVACVFDEDQNYLLEFGAGYVRFWKDGAAVAATVTGAWADATPYALGVVVSYSGTNYVCIQAHTSVTATNRPSTGGTWTDYWYALTGTIYELPTPYTTQAVLRTMQFAVEVGSLRIAHASYPFKTLTRLTASTWGFSTVATSYALEAPANLATDAPTPGTAASWVVTAYDAVNLVESLASAAVSSDTMPDSPSNVFTQTWDAVTGATAYRVYRANEGGTYGFLTEVSGTTFIDTGVYRPDTLQTPPIASADFGSSGDYPGVLGAYQQRLILSGSANDPDVVQTSRIGATTEFTVSSPLLDSDAVSWRMVGSRVVRPRHFLEVARKLIQFANVGEYVIEGDETGIITPEAVNPRLISANGAATYPSPIAVNDTALYVQARGGVVRDLADSGGDDLTLAASHLIEGYSIVEWAFQQTPHPVIWCVRSDGTLLSLTYERATGVLAWARHDTVGSSAGVFESVACVPEATEDAVYVVVRRTINAGTVRYLERLAAPTGATATLCRMDAATVTTMTRPYSTFTLDFTAPPVTVTLDGNGYATEYAGVSAVGSGGSGTFTAANVGDTGRLVILGALYTFEVTGYSSATTLTVTVTPDTPEAAQTGTKAITTGNWWFLSLPLTGLSYLEGEDVSIVANGYVMTSASNPAYTTATVTSGTVRVTPYGTVFNATAVPVMVGLPITTDIETLDLDGVQRTRKPTGLLVTNVGLWLDDSRTPFVGREFPDATNGVGEPMQQMPALDDDGEVDNYNLISGFRMVTVDGAWNSHGRICIRHVDPTPLTVLAIVPFGDFGRA